MSKVEIEFPTSFDETVETYIHIGRIYIGDHVGRLVLCKDGQVRMAISSKAATDGSLMFYEDLTKLADVFGLGGKPDNG
jgi:hypothetical protein